MASRACGKGVTLLLKDTVSSTLRLVQCSAAAILKFLIVLFFIFCFASAVPWNSGAWT